MILLDQQQKYALRSAMWRGRRYVPTGTAKGRTTFDHVFDEGAFVTAVAGVLTPIVVLEVSSVVDIDEVPLDVLWDRVEQRTTDRVREVTQRVLRSAEADGVSITDDLDSLDRALAAAFGLHSGKDEVDA